MPEENKAMITDVQWNSLCPQILSLASYHSFESCEKEYTGMQDFSTIVLFTFFKKLKIS